MWYEPSYLVVNLSWHSIKLFICSLTLPGSGVLKSTRVRGPGRPFVHNFAETYCTGSTFGTKVSIQNSKWFFKNIFKKYSQFYCIANNRLNNREFREQTKLSNYFNFQKKILISRISNGQNPIQTKFYENWRSFPVFMAQNKENNRK